MTNLRLASALSARTGPYDVAKVRATCLAYLDRYEHQPFSWPLDGVSNEPWGYRVHTSCVGAWNDEGRSTKCLPFTRAWLEAPGNIELALELRAADERRGVW